MRPEFAKFTIRRAYQRQKPCLLSMQMVLVMLKTELLMEVKDSNTSVDAKN